MRVLLFALALLCWGCSIYDPFSIDNPKSCRAQPTICGTQLICDQPSGRCLPAPVAALTGLTLTGGTLSPAFSPDTTLYSASLFPLTLTVQLTPTATAGATIEINGQPVVSGTASPPLAVNAGTQMITITLHAAGQPDKVYGVVVRQTPPDYLKASNTGGSDLLGASLTLSGDTLAIGAFRESSSASGINGNQADVGDPASGAVYVFVRTSAGWTQQAYLKASNNYPNSSELFGYSIALSGDTLAVGAHQEDGGSSGVNGDQANHGTPQSGAVYVFQRSGTTWTQQAYLKASNPQVADAFGHSVTLAGDTLAVGAYLEDSNGTETDNSVSDSGAVYVFQRSGGVWAQQAYLKASSPQKNDLFGTTVTLSGDTVAVGATGAATGTGAVYVFQRRDTTWTQQTMLTAGFPMTSAQFGNSVALSGDTLAVGAYQEDSGATGINGDQANNKALDSGAVYIFQRTGTSWPKQAYIKASNANAFDNFGVSVALSGDTLAVGADHEDSAAAGVNGAQGDNSSADSGAVYLFQRSGVTWTQTTYIKATQSYAGDLFGSSVALSEGTLAIGAPYEQGVTSGVNGDQTYRGVYGAGAGYVFR